MNFDKFYVLFYLIVWWLSGYSPFYFHVMWIGVSRLGSMANPFIYTLITTY